MKPSKYFLAFALSLSFINFYGMQEQPSVVRPAQNKFIHLWAQAAFMPKDDIRSKLFSFLDSAQKHIRVAMYWISDDLIVDKLISLKRNKNIEIEVIFDESSPDHIKVIDKLLQVGIIPLIFPSNTAGGIMHHKFIVVDKAVVFTGSANFTGKAFEFNNQYGNNYENIVILKSPDTAQIYISTFQRIKKEILSLYVDLVASSNHDQLPEWSDLLFPEYDFLRENAQTDLEEFSSSEEVNPPSAKQVYFLRAQGYEVEGMSFDEAHQLIGQIKREKRRALPSVSKKRSASSPVQEQEKIRKKQQVRKISPYQMRVLQDYGYQYNTLKDMSYDDAYALIGRL